jgi:hypothetical protein
VSGPELLIVYDLRDPAVRQAAHRHRAFWGRTHTQIVLLVFRPAPDERWRAWEQVRLRWILDEDLDKGKAA